jgi:NAD(P)-dependent dehydrogenase (short-subunit alcohol dehydrogenase family)
MDLGLKDKLALVTNSTAGIGLAVATTLARFTDAIRGRMLSLRIHFGKLDGSGRV